MREAGEFAAIAAREAGLKRELSNEQLSLIAIGGAIGTGLFLGSGFAIQMAGPAVLVSYAVGALITLLLMGALAEMAVEHPTTGSFGSWAEFYLGPLAGFTVRVSYWAAVVLAVGTEVTAIALYMRLWFPAVPGVVWIVLFGATVVAVNARHVGAFGAVEFVLSAMKLAAIAAFLVLGAWLLCSSHRPAGAGFANLEQHGGFFACGAGGMWRAVIVAFFSYLSVEMIAVAAAEARDPVRAIRRAFRSTFARLLVCYLATLTVVLALRPWDAAASAQGPFVGVMRSLHLPAAVGVVNFVLLVAALSAMNSQLYITSRMMFSLARSRAVGGGPGNSGALGRLNARGVPMRALLVSAAGIGVAAVMNALSPEKAFARMMAVAVFGGMYVWMMIFVTHLRFRSARLCDRRQNGARQPGELRFRMPGAPATSWLGLALMAALLVTTAFTEEFRLTLLYGVPFLAALALAFRVRRSSLRTSIKSSDGATTKESA